MRNAHSEHNQPPQGLTMCALLPNKHKNCVKCHCKKAGTQRHTSFERFARHFYQEIAQSAQTDKQLPKDKEARDSVMRMSDYSTYGLANTHR